MKPFVVIFVYGRCYQVRIPLASRPTVSRGYVSDSFIPGDYSPRMCRWAPLAEQWVLPTEQLLQATFHVAQKIRSYAIHVSIPLSPFTRKQQQTRPGWTGKGKERTTGKMEGPLEKRRRGKEEFSAFRPFPVGGGSEREEGPGEAPPAGLWSRGFGRSIWVSYS